MNIFKFLAALISILSIVIVSSSTNKVDKLSQELGEKELEIIQLNIQIDSLSCEIDYIKETENKLKLQLEDLLEKYDSLYNLNKDLRNEVALERMRSKISEVQKKIKYTSEKKEEVTGALSDAQLQYYNRFWHVAKAEEKKFGIPATIKMAQAILESNAGKSTLASKYRNHFGMKGYKGKVVRYADDDPDDKFKVFSTDWESWRRHSELITNSERYTLLFEETPDKFKEFSLKKGVKNYKAKLRHKELAIKNWHSIEKRWAYGLSALYYATDDSYPESLLKIIDKLPS